MGFLRQEYWRGLPCPPPGDLPDPGMEPGSPALQADSLLSETPGTHITAYNVGEIYGIHNLDSVRLNTRIQTLPIDNTEER